MTNHPLNDYEDILKQYKVKLFKDFENSAVSESFVAGTVMSLKEKKTAALLFKISLKCCWGAFFPRRHHMARPIYSGRGSSTDVRGGAGFL